MRAVRLIGVLLAGGVTSLCAQHASQLEFGGFGSYTRYDNAFGLNNQFGVGGRLGFFLTDFIGIEIDGNLAYPNLKVPLPPVLHTQMRWGSGSLVLNSGGEHNVFYILGGYSRMDNGVNPPYNFAMNAVHGGIGDRIFLGSRLALRLEGRGYYTLNNCCLSKQHPIEILGSAGLSVFLFGGGPKAPKAPPPAPAPAPPESVVVAAGQPTPPPPAGAPQPPVAAPAPAAPAAPPPPAPTPVRYTYVQATGHRHQLEFGGYGTYTRYDRAFGLNNQFGYGGRLGYFLNDYIGLEVDANLARPTPKAGGPYTQMRFGSASLVINGGGEKSLLYVLGGYSRLDMGVNPPYNFALHAAHGGIGERFFIGHNLALRLEARGYYAPKNCCLTQQWVGHVTGSAGLSIFLGGPKPEAVPEIPKAKAESILAAGGQLPEAPSGAAAGGYETRAGEWQHKWYWGAQGGLFVFKTNFESLSFEPTFGGHWLITGRRTALYTSYEESFFLTPRHATIIEPSGAIEPGNISFNNMRRIMVGVLAFPAQLRVEPFGGGGFALMEALNVQASCSNCTLTDLAQLQDEADNAATKAFIWVMGGVDIKQGRLALYGHYVITSSSASFLIQGTTHTFQGGIRYSLGSSKEDVTEH